MRLFLDGGAIAGIVIGGIAFVLVLSIIIWFIRSKNWFRATKIKIDEANSGIDVALTKRYDLLTKSLAIAKGYAKHESETLIETIKMRNEKGVSAMSQEEKSEFNSKLAGAQKSLDVVVENYPTLKADSHFLELQKQSADCEEQLQAARRLYNANVSIFNQKRVMFPSSIAAKSCGFLSDMEFFKAEEAKRADVKMDF